MSEDIVVHYKQEGITAFWRKIPFFLMFPFHIGPLVFLACIVAASALVGFLIGNLGLALKGFLVYLGLRYAFNVLELFSKGRFETESVDFSFWGPEKRPAKLGLVIGLFLLIGVLLGNYLVSARIAKNPAVQAQLVEQYKKDHALELAKREEEFNAYQKRLGIATGEHNSAASNEDSEHDDASGEPAAESESQSDSASAPDAEPAPQLDAGPSKEEILQLYQPTASDPLWHKLQPAWYWLVMLLLSLMLPAAAIVIALEDRFFKALNPAHVVFMTKAMGSSYFALWALFLFIAGARQLSMSLGAQLPMGLRFPLEMGLVTYLGIVLFAMMGYTLYQYHQELSLDVAVDFENHRMAGGAEAIANAGSAHAAIRQNEPQDPSERKVRALLAEGKVKEAIAEIKDNMRYDTFNPDLNSRLHPLYVQQGDTSVVLTHGQQWITALTRADRAKEAFDALQSLLKIDPTFVIEDGDAILAVAQAAVKKGEFAIAVQLIRGFDKRFPKHRDTAGILYLGAKLSSEHLRKQDNAIKILKMVLHHFPNDPIAPEAKNYLHVLEAALAHKAS